MSLDADLLYCRFLAYPPGGRRTRHVGRPGRAYSPGTSTGSSVMQDNASNVIPARAEFSAQQAELAGRVARNTPAPGLNETCVPGLALIRADAPSETLPSVYHPSLSVVVQGPTPAPLGGRAVVYTHRHYTVV